MFGKTVTGEGGARPPGLPSFSWSFTRRDRDIPHSRYNRQRWGVLPAVVAVKQRRAGVHASSADDEAWTQALLLDAPPGAARSPGARRGGADVRAEEQRVDEQPARAVPEAAEVRVVGEQHRPPAADADH